MNFTYGPVMPRPVNQFRGGGFFPPISKICAVVKLDHETPGFRGENSKKMFELPRS